MISSRWNTAKSVILYVGTWQFDAAKNLIDRIAANGWRVPHDINPQEYRGA